MLHKYQLNTSNVSYGSVQKLVISWRESQLKIFWESWPIPCPVVTFPCCGCHPSKVPPDWCSALPAAASTACPGNAIAVRGAGGLFHLSFSGFSNEKSSCLPQGQECFQLLLPSQAVENLSFDCLWVNKLIFRLLWNRTRIPFNIHWFFFVGGG